MNTDRRLDPLFRVIALIIATAGLAVFVHRFDARALARIDSMPPDAYLAYQRHVHGHSYLSEFTTFLVGGGLYVGAIELMVYGMRLCVPARGSND